MRQPDSLVIGLLARAKHVVPSTGASKELVRMTLDELTEVVRAGRGVAEPDATEVLLDSYRTKVRGVVRVMEALVEHRAHVPVEQVEEMHEELLEAAAGLSEAFKLEN